MEEIIKQYREGRSLKELAKILGKGPNAVKAVLKENGVEIRRRGGNQYRFSKNLNRKRVAAEYKKGVPITEIIKKFHIGGGTLYRILEEHNLSLRQGKTLNPGKEAQTERTEQTDMVSDVRPGKTKTAGAEWPEYFKYRNLHVRTGGNL